MHLLQNGQQQESRETSVFGLCPCQHLGCDTLYYSLVRCAHQEELGNAVPGISAYYLFQMHLGLQLSQNKISEVKQPVMCIWSHCFPSLKLSFAREQNRENKKMELTSQDHWEISLPDMKLSRYFSKTLAMLVCTANQEVLSEHLLCAQTQWFLQKQIPHLGRQPQQAMRPQQTAESKTQA